MVARAVILLGGLVGAGALYAFSRTKAGASAAVDAIGGTIEFGEQSFEDVTYYGAAAVTAAKEAAATVAGWVVPSSGLQFKKFFDAATAKYHLPEGLIARQAYQESRFRADIISGQTISSAGAIGIMQIIPKWHPEIDPGDAAADRAAALNPAKAIDYAGKYLRQLFNKYGSWELALAAYNAGPGNVDKYKGVPPFQETQNYVAQISRDVGLHA